MRNQRVEAPRVQRRLLTLFHLYARWYLWRHMHAIRVNTLRPPKLEGLPVIVCMNHPSWWDPLVALTLALRLFPERTHYAPMDASALSKYAFFERLGFFGVEAGRASGAATFLRRGSAILSRADSMLWVTAQGAFRDVRERPVDLRGGVGKLVAGNSPVAVLPVALEYVFWDERFPEVLVRFGEPLINPELSVVSSALQQTQDALAAVAMTRDPAAFETFAGGRTGVGGIYGLWRWVSS
jgi:1-acyl-sn-glycerol-3-phosphate acyltransferase